METINCPDVILSSRYGSETWPTWRWRKALNMLYKARAQEDKKKHIEADPFWESTELLLRFLILLDDEAVGMATLTKRSNGLGTALIGTVEDVYVHPEYRGQHLSRFLMEAVLREARRSRLITLELTSKPRRKEANSLYVSLGFQLVAKANLKIGDQATNFYRLSLFPLEKLFITP